MRPKDDVSSPESRVSVPYECSLARWKTGEGQGEGQGHVSSTHPSPTFGARKRIHLKLLGTPVDQITREEVLERIVGFIYSREPSHLVTANTLMLLEAAKDPELRTILENAALSIPESSGVRWAGFLKRKPFPEIIPGIDLMLMICDYLSSPPPLWGRGRVGGQTTPPPSLPSPIEGQTVFNHSIFLLGSAPGTAQRAAENLIAKFPRLKIVGIRDGYFKAEEEPDLIQQIRSSAPDVLFVGLGMPRQEKWIARHLCALGVPVVMGIGGSFDVISGNLARAPRWMQRAGVEWLYRLYQEPWRWRRIIQLPLFLWKVLGERGAQSVAKVAHNNNRD